MLQQFRKAKEAEIAALKKHIPAPLHRPLDKRFSRAIQTPLSLIAEYKRASPSRGDINLTLTPAMAAKAYAAAGASAISVLTEEQHFKGHLDYLAAMAEEVDVPLLRKDFIFSPLQVSATLATPAAALLLIVRLTPDVAQLQELRLQAESGGREAVVEVFDAADLELARASGASIIQVNARDLSTFSVSKQAQFALVEQEKGQVPGELWIAASGVESKSDLQAIKAAGFACALVGTSLMQSGQPGPALKQLLQGINNA